jgi:predicted nucleic acid-binding protein
MEKLGITQAFVFDHHFQQFGTIQTVPQTVER